MVQPNSLPTVTAAHRRCVRCVMDTTDPDITFDAHGVCSHCRKFETDIRPTWFPNAEGQRRLDALIARVKADGRDREYDCIIGVSGGVDSSYLAVKVKEFGLRPLVVHVDAGWNSELAVQNIERLVKGLGFDLHTIVIDWEEMRDLHLAFLRAGVPNQDVPQDHAFAAAVFQFARKHRVRWVINGANLATESILPAAWGYDSMDSRHLRAIHRRFGTRPLRTFPLLGFWHRLLLHRFVYGMRTLRPLDFMPYDKQTAIALLTERYGWRSYGAKHYESVFTKFFQGYLLPTRFGYDKRLAHLSSLIVTGQLTREAALVELEAPAYPPEDLRRDRAFVLRKLGLSESEFERLLQQPWKTHRDYPSYEKLNRVAGAVLHRLIMAARALRGAGKAAA